MIEANLIISYSVGRGGGYVLSVYAANSRWLIPSVVCNMWSHYPSTASADFKASRSPHSAAD